MMLDFFFRIVFKLVNKFLLDYLKLKKAQSFVMYRMVHLEQEWIVHVTAVIW